MTTLTGKNIDGRKDMSGKKNRKKRLLLLLAVIIGAALFFVWTEVSDAKEDALAKGEPQEMSITGTVMRMDITDEIFTDGFLEMESESVYMETDGIVEEVLRSEERRVG